VTLPPILTLLGELDTAIFRELPQTHHAPELGHFYTLLRDYPQRGGKRLRGLVLLLSAAAHGAPWQAGLGVAAALELFQNWVLIHDDIEDDSEERRGTPALHRQVGIPVALNVGDALHIYMWRTLLRSDFHSWAQQRRVVETFEELISRTAEGQHLDLAWVAGGRFDVSEHDYLEMVTLKSAYYTVVGPLELGALCAGAEPDPKLREAGKDLGIAFQIRDDVLNLMEDVSYGKEFAGDLFEAKRTLVLAHFFAHAPNARKTEVQEVLAKPRAEKSTGEIARLATLLRECGSIAYAQGIAEARAARGLEKLRESFVSLPDQKAAEAILQLLGEVAARRT
jgi:geranylgeranyl diphosphate synthase type II